MALRWYAPAVNGHITSMYNFSGKDPGIDGIAYAS
jgi:hypothetical protein